MPHCLKKDCRHQLLLINTIVSDMLVDINTLRDIQFFFWQYIDKLKLLCGTDYWRMFVVSHREQSVFGYKLYTELRQWYVFLVKPVCFKIQKW